MHVYLDNAATTSVDPEVLEAMTPYLLEDYGNPSSIHSHGRKAKAAIELARKNIAELLNTTPGEIFFTSGGTEADNTILHCAVEKYGIKHGISSRIEHHAVLHTMEHLASSGKIKLSFVNLDEKGHIDYAHLEELLKAHPRSLVSLMHANNEIGNITDIQRVGQLCEEYEALFHSDTVQSMAHYRHDLKTLNVHGIVGSAHKFHGPKGVGFMYINRTHKLHPYIYGGAQERNMRGGTENVCGIIGLAKALEIAYREMESHHEHIQGLKTRMIKKLEKNILGVSFNGDSADLQRSLYTVLNVCLPPSPENEMLLFNLDINGISASGGSACSSGASTGSHVLTGINSDPQCGSVRFSFSKYNTAEELDYVIDQLMSIFQVEV